MKKSHKIYMCGPLNQNCNDFCQFSFNLIGMNFVINVGGREFECVQRETIDNFKHYTKKNKYN